MSGSVFLHSECFMSFFFFRGFCFHSVTGVCRYLRSATRGRKNRRHHHYVRHQQAMIDLTGVLRAPLLHSGFPGYQQTSEIVKDGNRMPYSRGTSKEPMTSDVVTRLIRLRDVNSGCKGGGESNKDRPQATSGTAKDGFATSPTIPESNGDGIPAKPRQRDKLVIQQAKIKTQQIVHLNLRREAESTAG